MPWQGFYPLLLSHQWCGAKERGSLFGREQTLELGRLGLESRLPLTVVLLGKLLPSEPSSLKGVWMCLGPTAAGQVAEAGDVGAINNTPSATPSRAEDGTRGRRREPSLSLILGASKDPRAPWLVWVSPSRRGCCSWLPAVWVRRFMEGEPVPVPGFLCEFNEEQVMFLRSLWANSGEGRAWVRFWHLLCSGQRLVHFLQHWGHLQLD